MEWTLGGIALKQPGMQSHVLSCMLWSSKDASWRHSVGRVLCPRGVDAESQALGGGGLPCRWAQWGTKWESVASASTVYPGGPIQCVCGGGWPVLPGMFLSPKNKP